MNRHIVLPATASLLLAVSAAWAQVSLDPPLPAPETEPAPSAGPPQALSVAPPPPQPAVPFAASPQPAPRVTMPSMLQPAPVPASPQREAIVIPVAASPHWIVSAEALWLERTVGSSIPLGFSAFNNGSYGPHGWPIDGLYSDDAPFALTTGVRLQLGARTGDDKAFQATYWGMHEWSIGSAVYGDPAGDTVLAFSDWLQLPNLIGGLNDYVGFTYKSRVDSAEINRRLGLGPHHPFMTANWLWGVRYFRLSERFTLTGSDLGTGTFEDFDCRTTNNLVGPQIGIQFVRGWDRFQLTTEGKFGLLANFYSQRAADTADGTSGVPTGFQSFDVSQSGTGVSALFELSLLANFRVSEHLWVRAGYQLYAVTGLALGPRQLEKFTHGGTVGLDGLSLGLEATW